VADLSTEASGQINSTMTERWSTRRSSRNRNTWDIASSVTGSVLRSRLRVRIAFVPRRTLRPLSIPVSGSREKGIMIPPSGPTARVIDRSLLKKGKKRKKGRPESDEAKAPPRYIQLALSQVLLRMSMYERNSRSDNYPWNRIRPRIDSFIWSYLRVAAYSWNVAQQ